MTNFSFISPIINHKQYDSELPVTFSGLCQAHRGEFHDDEDEPQHKS